MWHTIACWQGGSFRFHTQVTNIPKLIELMQRYVDDGYRCLVMTGFKSKTAAEKWAKDIGKESNA